MEKRVSVLYTVEISVTEEDDGYFVAVTDPFHLTVYADTEEKAEQRASEAIDLLLDRHTETPQAFTDYLNKRGVKHFVVTRDQEMPLFVSKQPRYRCIRNVERELEYA